MPIIIRNGNIVRLSAAIESLEISKGEAPKSFLTDGFHRYILKRPKKRTFSTIFKESFPTDLVQFREWTLEDFCQAKASLPPLTIARLEPYVLHLKDLLFEAAFGEILYQRIAQALFNKSFAATENYLHIDKETGVSCIISQFCPSFNEFLDKRLSALVKKRKMSVSEWDEHPALRRDDLQFNTNEYYLLGKLYALALITNDWDLVNTIMLSNAGCMGDSSYANKIMVVDGGNKFHFGFDGLTCDETAFENNTFNPKSTKKHPLKGYEHTLPFDEEVHLQLPRLLVPDLFSLTNPAVYKGFQEGINEAKTALISNPFCIRQAIREAGYFITADSHKETLKRFWGKDGTLLNRSFYYPRSSSTYNLESLLKSRCYSLVGICRRLEHGESEESINETTLTLYQKAQAYPSKASVFFELPSTCTQSTSSDPVYRKIPF
jgi:hypothetical protein